MVRQETTTPSAKRKRSTVEGGPTPTAPSEARPPPSKRSRPSPDRAGDGPREPPPPPPGRRRRGVRFAEPAVAGAADAHGPAEYDRTAAPADRFHCDVCSAVIPAGIRGFEPYATCGRGEGCPDGGFDACVRCADVVAVASATGKGPSPRGGGLKKSVKVRGHRHRLVVVDPGEEVAWASGSTKVKWETGRR